MIKVENIEVFNFEGALRGMRNPKNSWDKSDTIMSLELRHNENHAKVYADIGSNDLDLMRKLYRGGSEHRKYARQIFVSMDITCNHIFWAEFDTYKVGVTRNSCSKMHKIHDIEFTADDFSHEGIDEVGGQTKEHFDNTLTELERLRILFNDTGEKKYWRAMLELLPIGYNLKATITMNYENVFNIIHQRSHHKLDEWKEFVNILTNELPYVREIMEVDA